MQARTAGSVRSGKYLVLVLLLGLAAVSVYSTRTSYQLRQQLREAKARLENSKPAGRVSPPSEEHGLRERLTARERELESLRQQVADLSRPTPAAAPTAASGFSVTNRPGWMERLQQQDPARYQQLVAQREQWRQRVDSFFTEQFQRLEERWRTARSEEEAQLVSDLSATLSRAEELRAQWEGLRELPEEQRRAQAEKLAAESAQVYQQLAELRQQDRQLQLRQLARDIGYQDPSQIAAFVDTVQRITQETEMGFGRFFGRRGGGPGPGGTTGP